jgi:uroporphyrinogen-III decarboxylase
MENAVKTGRFGTVIESLRRINKVSGAEVALAAVVSGPLTLMAGLTGKDPLKELTDRPEETFKNIEAAAGFLLKIVQVYCQLELDIIAIADRWIASLPAAPLHRVQPVFSPMVNTARFYNAFSVLLPGEPSPDNVASVLDLGFDGTVAAGIDTARWQETKGGRSCVLGKAVATDVMRSGAREVQEYLNKHIPGKTERGMFLTTEWEVPPETPPDNIHMVMSMVSGKQRP